jgi:hypothetical protein
MTTVPLTFESRVSWRDGDDSQAALRSGLELAGAGAFLAFDGPNRASHPTDWRLIDVIADLIEAGFADRVLVGADSLDATARFATGGGPGAAGVLTHTAARVGAVNISQADSAMGEDGRPPALGPGGPQLLATPASSQASLVDHALLASRRPGIQLAAEHWTRQTMGSRHAPLSPQARRAGRQLDPTSHDHSNLTGARCCLHERPALPTRPDAPCG